MIARLENIEQLKGSKALAPALVMTTPESWDEATNSVEVQFYTGASVRRYSWSEGDFNLSFKLEGGDFGRYNRGAAVLKDHNDHTSNAQVGKVMEGSARLDGAVCKCRVQFSRDPALAAFVQDVKDGIRKNWSMGVEIGGFEYTSKAGVAGATATNVVATSWEPYELSIVPVPADPGAQTLSKDSKENQAMDIQAQLDAAKAEGERMGEQRAAERARLNAQRVAQIATMSTLLVNLGHADGKAFVQALADDESCTVAVAREKVNAEATRLSESTSISPAKRGVVGVGADANGKLGKIFAKGLAIQMGAKSVRLSDEELGQLPEHMSLRRLCEEHLRKTGVNVANLSDEQIVQRSFERSRSAEALVRFQDTYSKRERLGEITTSDLPLLLASSNALLLMDSYAAAPSTYQEVYKRIPMRNFVPIQMIDHSRFPTLKEIPQSGIPIFGTVAESAETLTLKEWGRKIGWSRQAVVNDRFDLIGAVSAGLGSRIVLDKNAAAWAKILANPTLSADSVVVFHASHGNVGTAGALSVTTVGELRKLIKEQTVLADGEGVAQKTNNAMRILAVGSANETLAEQLMSSLYTPSAASGVMPGSLRSLKVIADAEITGTNFLGFADPNTAPCFVETVLGDEGVLTDLIYDEESKGVSLVVRVAYNHQAVSHRGAAKNAGA